MNKRTAVIIGAFLFATVALFVVARVTYYFPEEGAGNGENGSLERRGNSVKLPLYDPESGRLLAAVRAELKESAQIKIGPSGIVHSYNFGKGKVSLPVEFPSDDSSGSRKSAENRREFTLSFEEAKFRSDRGSPRRGKISLPEECTGRLGKDTVIRGRALKVNSEGSGLVTLETNEPVTIERKDPYLKLIGKNGVSGRFERQSNVYRLNFPARADSPVFAFLRRGKGSGFLGISSGGSKSRIEAEYICVECEGALVLDWVRQEVVFNLGVVISPVEELKRPSKPSERRFECHKLVVSLSREQGGLSGAVAERGPNQPVRGYWDTVTLEGGKVKWYAEKDIAELTDSPHMWGKTAEFSFDATAEKIVMENRSSKAKLLGPIEGFIEQSVSGGESRLPSSWKLVVDYGEVHFSREKSFHITEFIASADPVLASPNAVRLLSRRKGTVRAEGGRLRYKVAAQTLSVTGSAGARPFVNVERRGERLHADSREVLFLFRQGHIVLKENVKAKFIRKGKEGSELVHRLYAHWVRMAGTPKTGVVDVQAKAEDKDAPLRLEYDGPPRCRLEGGKLDWRRDTGKAVVSPMNGIDRQVISFLAGRLGCRELEFRPEEKRAYAEGDVAVLLNTEQGELRLTCDEARCRVSPKALKASGPPSLASVESIVASAVPGKRVSLQGKDVEALAGEIQYEASQGSLVMKGADKQEFYYLGKEGRDKVEAQTVKFIPSENRLVLGGGVSGTLHQRNWSKKEGTESSDRVPVEPWHYEARTAELQFRREGEKWELVSLNATGEILLKNSEVPLVVKGDKLEFSPEIQGILLNSAEKNSGLQMIRYGPAPEASYLTARAIRIQERQKFERGNFKDKIVATLTDNVTCHFHIRSFQSKKKASALVPEEVTLNADRVIFVVPARKETVGVSVSYAEAEGNVGFVTSAPSKEAKGYSGSGTRAEYYSRPVRLILYGDRKHGKAVVTHPIGSEEAEVIMLRRRSDGSLDVESGSLETTKRE